MFNSWRANGNDNTYFICKVHNAEEMNMFFAIYGKGYRPVDHSVYGENLIDEHLKKHPYVYAYLGFTGVRGIFPENHKDDSEEYIEVSLPTNRISMILRELSKI
ncbi:MAG: hypothetical protein JHC33_05330 [Ignisphaera sp.]|nr:hypothetical protein [Ignisphaera sp.]